MAANFHEINKNEIIEISSDEDDNNTTEIIEPTPIPTLSEYLGQTYRIFYGGEYHPHYDRRLRKFVTYPVQVPSDIEDDYDDCDDLSDDDDDDDEPRLVIDEENKLEYVINIKVLFDECDDASSVQSAEMNFTVEAESETTSLMNQINSILYENDKPTESVEEVQEECKMLVC